MASKTQGKNSKKTPDTSATKRWWFAPSVILTLSCLLGLFIIRSNDTSISRTASSTAQAPIACLSTAQETDIDCWYERMESMVEQNETTDKAFADIETAYDASAFVKSNCHQIAHVIGRTAGKKYGDVAKAYQDGNDFCWSGYFHGVMEAIIASEDAETITTNLDTICAGLRDENVHGFDHYNCVHGLGHGLMQLQDNELFIALDTCQNLNDGWEQQSCQGGVFMENVMNAINPGHESRYLRDDEPLYPCTTVSPTYKYQCYLMQTSHALTLLGRDFSRVFALCATVEAPNNSTCYQSLGRDASGSTSSDIQETRRLCNLGTTEDMRRNCFIGAVKDFISYFNNDDQGLALCETIEEPAISTTCTKTAQLYYGGL